MIHDDIIYVGRISRYPHKNITQKKKTKPKNAIKLKKWKNKDYKLEL